MRKYKKYKHKRVYRKRNKKSLFRSRIFLLTLLFLFFMGAFAYFLLFSSFFQIKEIKISGNIKVPVEDLKNTISNQIDKKIIFVNFKNIFFANLDELNEIILEKFPQIAKVNLDRKFPDVLAAQIEERKPVALFVRGENYFYIDKTGVIFEEVSEPHQMLRIKLTSVPDLELGKRIIDEENITQILKINSKLNDLKIPLEELLVVSERRVNAKTSEGWEIYFNPQRDIEWQLTDLSLLLKQRIPPEKRGNLEYIDLRFEKIYVFPENYLE